MREEKREEIKMLICSLPNDTTHPEKVNSNNIFFLLIGGGCCGHMQPKIVALVVFVVQIKIQY